MRFALLCDDPQAGPLITALSANVDGHQLRRSQAERLTDSFAARASIDTAMGPAWEELLIAKDVDAVIVAGTRQSVLDGAKQLAAEGIPLLFIPHAGQGSTFAYELGLIQDDNHVLLFPVFWHRFDAAVSRLRTAIKSGELGRIQYLQLQRSMRAASGDAPLQQQLIDIELLPDVDLARWLVGEFNQVTALRTAVSSDGVLRQNVILSGRDLPEFNWSIQSTAGPDQWLLTVKGEGCSAVLRRLGSSQAWQYEFGEETVVGDEPFTTRFILSEFNKAVIQSQPDRSSEAVTGNWGELVKCFETIDATYRSVARRRTIELHFEPMSERSIFKSQMTAIGCGLLIATFLLTLAYLGIASLVPLPSRVLIGLRAIVFAPLVLFLIAQILLPLTRPSSASRQDE